MVLTGVVLGVGSCGKEGSDKQPGAEGKMTIAVVPKGTTHVFWKSIHAGAIKAAQELSAEGVQVELVWKGPLKEDDRESQIKVMEDIIALGVDGIVLAPLDDVALRVVVEEATRAGIPVVIIDSALQSEAYVSFVATDNYVGGKKAGEHVVDILEGKGKVVMLRFAEGSASTMNREQAFLDVMAEHAGIEMVSSNRYGGATTESAYRQSENLLNPLLTEEGGLTIDVIFCPNESTAFGMLRALEDMKLLGKVAYVGFDASEKLVHALGNGTMQGLVLQDPINMGYLGVKTLVDHLQGKSVAKRIDTGSRLATPENMGEPEVARLLDPEFKKWLGEE